MPRQVIGCQAKDVTKVFRVWLFLFLLLCTSNLCTVAGSGSHGNLDYLSMETVIVMAGYWLCNFAYSFILFGRLWDGEQIGVFPLFILLQFLALLIVQREDLVKFLRETVQPNRHLSVPFLYTVGVYLLKVIFLRRLKLYSFNDRPVVPDDK